MSTVVGFDSAADCRQDSLTFQAWGPRSSKGTETIPVGLGSGRLGRPGITALCSQSTIATLYSVGEAS
jgi:hypothetical protein